LKHVDEVGTGAESNVHVLRILIVNLGVNLAKPPAGADFEVNSLNVCVTCPEGQKFDGNGVGVCVCTKAWLVPFEDSCVCADDKEEFGEACFTPCEGGREFKSADDGLFASGDCACPVDNEVSPETGACFVCPSVQVFGGHRKRLRLHQQPWLPTRQEV
jgi:hypothetical protein